MSLLQVHCYSHLQSIFWHGGEMLNRTSPLCIGRCFALWSSTFAVGGAVPFLCCSSPVISSSLVKEYKQLSAFLAKCDLSMWFSANVFSIGFNVPWEDLFSLDWRVVVLDGFSVVVEFSRLVFDCTGTVMLGVFLLLQQSTRSQSSRPSFPNTQKKRKMKKPCSELNMAKANRKTVEFWWTVRVPNTHISPKKTINTMMLTMKRTTVCRFAWSVLQCLFW